MLFTGPDNSMARCIIRAVCRFFARKSAGLHGGEACFGLGPMFAASALPSDRSEA
jgi:hypothetical protein